MKMFFAARHAVRREVSHARWRCPTPEGLGERRGGSAFPAGKAMIGVRRTPQGVAKGDGGCRTTLRRARASRRRGRVYFFCQARQKKIPKRTRLKGYANRKGYALIYYDIARFFFFPKHTIRLYFYSRSALREGFVRTSREDV